MSDKRPFGSFVLERSIEKSAAGEAFIARTAWGEVPIAELKLISTPPSGAPEPRPREQLKHPNIVVALESGSIDGQHYIVSELVLGKSVAAIRERLRRDRATTPVSIGARLLGDGLTGLAWLHERMRLVHGAVTPANMIVSYGGVAKLAEVGVPLARLGPGDPLAPEVRAGKPRTPSSDLYALAATVNHLLAGMRDVHGPLGALLAKLLSPDPKDRPQNARAALRELLSNALQEHAPASRVIVSRWMSELFAEEKKQELADLEVLTGEVSEEELPSFGQNEEDSTAAEWVEESGTVEEMATFGLEPTLAHDAVMTERYQAQPPPVAVMPATERHQAQTPRSPRKNTVVLVEDEDNSTPRAPVPVLEANAFGPYRLLSKIGHGGMSQVHRAMRVTDEGSEPCVIKRIDSALRDDPDYTLMFEEESRIAAVLKHPNIVEHLESGAIEGVAYISFELVDGLDLAQLISALSPDRLPPHAAIEIAIDLARALDHAHNLTGNDGRPLELVHRDVSPENVLISWSGEVKLIDFGLSKFEGRGFKTRAGIIKAKIGYAAPEQLEVRRIDARTDLYQLGVVLAEMLAGQRLFGPEVLTRPKNRPELRALLERHLAVAGALPPELIDLLTRLCAWDPNERPASAKSVLAELSAINNRLDKTETLAAIIRAQAPSEAVVPTAEHRQQTLVRSKKSGVAWMAIGLVLVVAIVAWIVSSILQP